jgi:biopolymer transport protein ExbB/TolQ
VLTVSVWLAFKALQFWLDLPPDDYSYNTIPGLANKLFNRGFVPYGIMGTMFFALARLRSIHRSKLGTDEAAAGSIAADHPANEKVRETTETMTASQWQAWLDAQYRATLPGAGGADKVGDPGATGFYASCRSKLVARQSPDRDIRVVSAMRDEILAAEEDDLARSMVPVRWCENTLPVLGFLGTVIGMGTAIGAMGTTIRSIARNRLLAPDDFASAFDGMMIAFDTTFLGLIGLLVVSLYHTTLRRKLSAGLAGTREFTDIVIDRLKNEAVVDELGAILVENHLTRDLSASTRSLALHAIAQGDDPTLRAIRKALLAPVVEFEELGGLADRLRDHVTGEVDNGEWEIDALGFPVSRDSWGCAALTVRDRKGTKHFILTFDLEATTLVPLAPASQLVELFPGHHPGVLLGREASGETVLLERRAESDAPYVRRPLESVGGQRARQSHAIRIEQVIHVLLVDDADVAVVLDRGAETLLDRGAETLAAQAFAVRVGGQRPDPLEPIPLPRGYEWTDWATHPASATLLAVGKAKKGGGWKVLILRVGRRSGRLELTDEFRKEIPLSGVEPRRIVALSGDEFLVLDTAGNLHYRHPHFKGFRPVRDAADAGWRPADHADSRIWPGRNGWIAVRRADKLEMWQVGYPGVLRRYDGEPVDFGDAGDGRSDAMARVAAQGEYLVTVARTNGRGPRKLQTIGGWRFPQTAMDSFS